MDLIANFDALHWNESIPREEQRSLWKAIATTELQSTPSGLKCVQLVTVADIADVASDVAENRFQFTFVVPLGKSEPTVAALLADCLDGKGAHVRILATLLNRPDDVLHPSADGVDLVDLRLQWRTVPVSRNE